MYLLVIDTKTELVDSSPHFVYCKPPSQPTTTSCVLEV